MTTYGFLDVLQEELDKNFPFDYEISWDKRNHAVEVSFLLSTVALKVRKAYLVVPAMAEAILVLPIPGGP